MEFSQIIKSNKPPKLLTHISTHFRVAHTCDSGDSGDSLDSIVF